MRGRLWMSSGRGDREEVTWWGLSSISIMKNGSEGVRQFKHTNAQCFFCFVCLLKGFFGRSFSSSKLRVSGQRVSYPVQIVKPLEANCDWWYWAILIKIDLTWKVSKLWYRRDENWNHTCSHTDWLIHTYSTALIHGSYYSSLTVFSLLCLQTVELVLVLTHTMNIWWRPTFF